MEALPLACVSHGFERCNSVWRRKRLAEQRQELKSRESLFHANTQANLQMKMQMAEATGKTLQAAKYRDMLQDYWPKREKEQASIQERSRLD